MRFFYIAPVVPFDAGHLAAEALRIYRQCGLDEPLWCFTLQPEGRHAFDKVEKFRDLFRECKHLLAGTPVKPGILFQSLVGHGWSGGPGCGEAWQRTVTLRDIKSDRFCILDPGFRQYVYDTVNIMAAEKPAFLLMDDDLRQIDTHGLECFCPEHLRQFNAAAGTEFSAHRLQEHIGGSRQGDPYLQLFERLRRDNLLGFMRLIRDAVDAADPALSCGYCAPVYEMYLADEMGRILAGKNAEPVVRLSNADYQENGPRELIRVNSMTHMLRNMMPQVKCVLDESDTFPHHRYSKSARSMNAKITLAAWNGLDGCKLWLTNLTTPDSVTEQTYDRVVAGNRKRWNALRDLIATAIPTGAVTPLPRMDAYAELHHPAHYEELLYRNDWQSQLLSRFGIPARYAPIDGDRKRIYLLAEDMVRFFSDAEIAVMLRARAVVDAGAAALLAQRGFAPQLGVKVVSGDFRCGAELDPGTGNRLLFMNNGRAVRLEPTGNTRELSQLIDLPHHYAPEYSRIASALTVADNDEGGRIAVFAMSLAMPFIEHPHRRLQLLRVLELLAESPPDAIVNSDQDIFLQSARLPDGAMLLAVWNLSFDPLDTVEFLFAAPPARLMEMTGDGTWEELEFHTAGAATVCSRSLATYEGMIVKVV